MFAPGSGWKTVQKGPARSPRPLVLPRSHVPRSRSRRPAPQPREDRGGWTRERALEHPKVWMDAPGCHTHAWKRRLLPRGCAPPTCPQTLARWGLRRAERQLAGLTRLHTTLPLSRPLPSFPWDRLHHEWNTNGVSPTSTHLQQTAPAEWIITGYISRNCVC